MTEHVLLHGRAVLATAGASADWSQALPPTRSAALARIARVQPAVYAVTRNHVSGAVTGLSPYITHGVVTLRDVLAGVLQQGPFLANPGSLTVGHKLVFELGWREYFRHVWAQVGDGIFESLHAGPCPDAAYAQTLPADIRQARTGVAAIDQAVRTLYATGTLHNHARMWLASYVVHLRHVHWRVGADWLAAHLLDGDLASNHLSWQWVAGTGSHKPYLFNADNVARFAPPVWHSPGTVIEQSYEALDAIARSAGAGVYPGTNFDNSTEQAQGTSEPELHPAPPASLNLHAPDVAAIAALRGRDVWLVHPWALRPPPADLPASTVVIGVYLRDYHQARPWPEARWQWVDAAMQEVAPQRWWTDAAGLATALAGAASVRSVSDPHISRWLQPIAQLHAEPTLFPNVDQRCDSFSQWWTRATRGLQHAHDLL